MISLEILKSLNDHFADHASTAVGLAVEVVGASGGEGFLPGFAGVEGEVRVAVLVVAFENSGYEEPVCC